MFIQVTAKNVGGVFYETQCTYVPVFSNRCITNVLVMMTTMLMLFRLSFEINRFFGLVRL